MPMSPHGFWIPDLFDRQLEVFNNRDRALLISGPRLSGKTRAALHLIIRHMWEVNGARVAMFSRTIKNSKDGGSWSLLHRTIIQEWIRANIGLVYTTKNSEGAPGWRIQGDTRTPIFRIRNSHGTESECMLFSLDCDADVEDKLKEMEFSMIFFSELSKFFDRKVLSVALLSLRLDGVPFEQQRWVGDTNPSEEGEASWIYRVWYVEKNQTYEEYAEVNRELGHDVLPEAEFLDFQRNLGLIEIKPEENPRLDPRALSELKSTYHYDHGLYQRYVNGKWVYGDGDSSRHFRSFFKENIHVVGSIESVVEEDWIYANPHPNSVELITGWDLGDVNNHAWGAIDKRVHPNVANGRACFTILDELVSINQELSIDDFTAAAMEMIEALEEAAEKKFVLDNAWSDSSSFDYSAIADNYPHLVVNAASGGRIWLQRGPKKSPGSVKLRVQLIKQLLAQGRLKVSAHCEATIRMLRDLKKGKTPLTFVVSDENKHIFDALTYALLMECAQELESGPPTNLGKREPLILHVR